MAQEQKFIRGKRLFSLLIFCVLVGAVFVASHWPLRASIIVLVLGGAGLVLGLLQLVSEFKPERSPSAAGGITFDTPRHQPMNRWGNLEIWAWILGFYGAIHLVGFLTAVPLFVFSYSRFYGAGWPLSLALSGLCSAFVYALFDQVINVPWPKAVLFSLFS